MKREKFQQRPLIGEELKSNPFDLFHFNTYKFWEKSFWDFGLENRKWKEKSIKVLNYEMERKLKKKKEDWFLPKKLKLYHTTFEYPLKLKSERFTFFGLDSELPLWYLMERKEMEKSKRTKKKGYLYVYEIKKDLKVTNYWSDITINPKDENICKQKDKICLHPQISFRGSSGKDSVFFDMGIEITMFFDPDKLFISGIYEVDLNEMVENHSIRSYDVRSSIKKQLKIL